MADPSKLGEESEEFEFSESSTIYDYLGSTSNMPVLEQKEEQPEASENKTDLPGSDEVGQPEASEDTTALEAEEEEQDASEDTNNSYFSSPYHYIRCFDSDASLSPFCHTFSDDIDSSTTFSDSSDIMVISEYFFEKELTSLKNYMSRQKGMDPIEASHCLDTLEFDLTGDYLYEAVSVSVCDEQTDKDIIEKLYEKMECFEMTDSYKPQFDDLKYVFQKDVECSFYGIFLLDPGRFDGDEDEFPPHNLNIDDFRDNSVYKLDLKTCYVIFCALGLLHPDRFSLKHQCMAVVRKAAKIPGCCGYCLHSVLDKHKTHVAGQSKHVPGHSPESPTAVYFQLDSIKDILANLGIPLHLAEELKGITYLRGENIHGSFNGEFDHDDILVAINRPCGVAVAAYGSYLNMD